MLIINWCKKTKKANKASSSYDVTQVQAVFCYTFFCGEKADNGLSRADNKEQQINDHRHSVQELVYQSIL